MVDLTKHLQETPKPTYDPNDPGKTVDTKGADALLARLLDKIDRLQADVEDVKKTNGTDLLDSYR